MLIAIWPDWETDVIQYSNPSQAILAELKAQEYTFNSFIHNDFVQQRDNI